MKSFQNKISVITGAGSGLGRSFALQLAAAGSHLALCDLDMDGLEKTRRMIRNDGKRVSLHHVNVADQAQMENFSIEVLATHGAVDILINNAGICYRPMSFEETTNSQLEQMINVNLWGVIHGIHAFLPHLKIRQEAYIVNISSLAGLVGLFGHSAYSISKSAVRGLTESLQVELAGSSVKIMVVHPGGVKTNLIRNAPNLLENERDISHDLFTKLAFLDADKTVKKILHAVQKKRNRVIIGTDAHLIYWLCRLFPQSYHRVLQAFFSYASFKPKE
ncbi:MAG: SDR family NAD(P)-dependent oxidoreductase [Chloroflexi bacterium]|nr:SDR family NAD(P)-dependent oxidoreductase [Chloroflexota bacterium]